MTRTRSGAGSECPSWANLARVAAEGGPWPAEHLRACPQCTDRREFLVKLYSMGASVDDTAPEGQACPDPVELIALVEGEIEADHRLRLADHLSGCEPCAALLRELVALASFEDGDWEVRDAPPVGAERDEAVSPALRLRAASMLSRVAAVLVAAVAVGALYLVPFPAIDSGSEGRWRGPAASLEAELSSPQRGVAPSLQWVAQTGATSYRVRVWRESGERIFEQHLPANGPLGLPLTLNRVASGELIFWQIDALAAGVVTATSGPSRFRWPAP